MHRCLFLLAISLVACTGDVTRAAGPLVRDSAGVRIVENSTPMWHEGVAWRLSPEPVVDIGGGDTEETQLFRVRGAVRLSDGRIVLANAGSGQLRFYDSLGDYERFAGGLGEGPGEFRDISRLYRMPDDSLLAYDIAMRRATIVTRQGQVARTMVLRGMAGSNPQPLGVFGDGQLLMRSYLGQAGSSEGRYRIPGGLYRVRADGTGFDSLGVNAGTEYLHLRVGGLSMLIPALFNRYGRAVTDNLSYSVVNTSTYEIRTHDHTGALVSIIRRAVTPQRIGNDELAGEVARSLANLGERAREGAASAIGDTEVPEFMPVLGSWYDTGRNLVLLPDAEGNLWVREYEAPTERDVRWSVFDSAGAYLGMIRNWPARFTPFEIGPDYVLGVWRDADDVEHVQMYELVKP